MHNDVCFTGEPCHTVTIAVLYYKMSRRQFFWMICGFVPDSVILGWYVHELNSSWNIELGFIDHIWIEGHYCQK